MCVHLVGRGHLGVEADDGEGAALVVEVEGDAVVSGGDGHQYGVAFAEVGHGLFESHLVGLEVVFHAEGPVEGDGAHELILLEDEAEFVEPEHRGKGIGKALLRHLARKCRDEGLPRLQWWVINWNEPSIAFYKSLGAVPMDEWTVYRLTGEPLKRLADS